MDGLYLVFAFDQYYPNGGWADHRGSYPAFGHAFQRAKALKDRYDYVEVVNVFTGLVVAEWRDGDKVE